MQRSSELLADPGTTGASEAEIEQAAKKKVKILCLQELFYGPYFCAEQNPRWYEAVERIPDGPTVKLMQDVAKQFGMVIIVPIYEEEQTGVYYNSAAVIDAECVGDRNRQRIRDQWRGRHKRNERTSETTQRGAESLAG